MKEKWSKKDAERKEFKKRFKFVVIASRELAEKIFPIEVVKETEVQVIKTPVGLVFIHILLIVKDKIRKSELEGVLEKVKEFRETLEEKVSNVFKESQEKRVFVYVIGEEFREVVVPLIMQVAEDIIDSYWEYLMSLVSKETDIEKEYIYLDKNQKEL